MVPNWAYGAMALLFVVHLAATTLAWVRHGRSAFEDVDAGDGDTVACPSCGAENERGYRFCRNCASELPGVSRARFAAGPARAGRTI